MAVSENDIELRNDVHTELLNADRQLYDTWLKLTCVYANISGCYIDITCGAGGQESCDWVANMKE